MNAQRLSSERLKQASSAFGDSDGIVGELVREVHALKADRNVIYEALRAERAHTGAMREALVGTRNFLIRFKRTCQSDALEREVFAEARKIDSALAASSGPAEQADDEGKP